MSTTIRQGIENIKNYHFNNRLNDEFLYEVKSLARQKDFLENELLIKKVSVQNRELFLHFLRRGCDLQEAFKCSEIAEKITFETFLTNSDIMNSTFLCLTIKNSFKK